MQTHRESSKEETYRNLLSSGENRKNKPVTRYVVSHVKIAFILEFILEYMLPYRDNSSLLITQ